MQAAWVGISSRPCGVPCPGPQLRDTTREHLLGGTKGPLGCPVHAMSCWMPWGKAPNLRYLLAKRHVSQLKPPYYCNSSRTTGVPAVLCGKAQHFLRGSPINDLTLISFYRHVRHANNCGSTHPQLNQEKNLPKFHGSGPADDWSHTKNPAPLRAPPPSGALSQRARRHLFGLRAEKADEKLQINPAGPPVYPRPQSRPQFPVLAARGGAPAAPRGLPGLCPGPPAGSSAPAPARPQRGGGGGASLLLPFPPRGCATCAPAPRPWAVRTARPGPSAPLPTGPAHRHRGLYLRPAPDAPLRLLGGRGAAERWGRGGGRRDGRPRPPARRGCGEGHGTAGPGQRRGWGGGGGAGPAGQGWQRKGGSAASCPADRAGIVAWNGKGWRVTARCLSRCWLGGCCIPGREGQPRVAHPR